MLVELLFNTILFETFLWGLGQDRGLIFYHRVLGNTLLFETFLWGRRYRVQDFVE